MKQFSIRSRLLFRATSRSGRQARTDSSVSFVNPDGTPVRYFRRFRTFIIRQREDKSLVMARSSRYELITIRSTRTDSSVSFVNPDGTPVGYVRTFRSFRSFVIR